MAVLSRANQFAISLTLLTLTLGTYYSYQNNTYLDTSNPLIANLAHPHEANSYFASKKTVLNQLFVKRAWGWTSAVFWAVWILADERLVSGGIQTIDAVGRWFAATGLWMIFAGWFFGPSLFARFLSYSGGECVISVPASSAQDFPHVISVPAAFCDTRIPVSPVTHPALFSDPALASFAGHQFKPDFKAVPRLYKGHDISGHTFLLTLCTLFLIDALVRARRGAATTPSVIAQVVGWGFVALWLVMLGSTAVYFHTWGEKASAYGELVVSRLESVN